VKKILIIKHGSLGDIILALSAFESIRNYYIKSKITLLTEKKYINFLKISPYVDEFIEDNRSQTLFYSIFDKLKIFNRKFDLIIDLQNSKRTSLYNIFFRMFQKTIICSSRPFSHLRYKIPKQGQETISAGLFKQLKLLGIKEIKNNNYSWLSTTLENEIRKPLALFIPGVSKNSTYKQWQPQKFVEVAKYLEKLNYTICVIGTKNDKDSILPILKSCKNTIDKIETSPPEIIYSLAVNSKIIFSNDTGPGHIAALAKNNFIWIVNDNNISEANKPIGNHVHIIKSISVKDISSQKVIKYIKENKLC
tara:strand:- start:486 stop:1406 length:921 start_codon:yes stop_codon:yes gene_type:complete